MGFRAPPHFTPCFNPLHGQTGLVPMEPHVLHFNNVGLGFFMLFSFCRLCLTGFSVFLILLVFALLVGCILIGCHTGYAYCPLQTALGVTALGHSPASWALMFPHLLFSLLPPACGLSEDGFIAGVYPVPEVDHSVNNLVDGVRAD